ncbi:MAG: DNA repair protein RadC [Treponemataceae bacterium]|nr:DNA repair protein RadC [Treponemataceae bacterium]
METQYKINKNYPELNVREKFQTEKICNITTQELLMLILGSGIRDCPVDMLAWKVLDVLDYKESDDLFEKLCKVKGMGKTKAITICACLELGKRLVSRTKKTISNAADIVPLVNHYSLENVEYFILITLNAANEIIKIKEISKGSSNSARIQPREVFSQVLKDNGSAVIFVHNHPSGNVLPSKQDIELTKRLMMGAKLLGISTLDHIIIGMQAYYSMANEGIINMLEKEI